jgi:hypothetical protein
MNTYSKIFSKYLRNISFEKNSKLNQNIFIMYYNVNICLTFPQNISHLNNFLKNKNPYNVSKRSLQSLMSAFE